MKTKAVRLYGEMDLRLDEFELPEMQDDEIMAEVVQTAYVCPVTKQSPRHKNTKKYQMISVKIRSF